MESDSLCAIESVRIKAICSSGHFGLSAPAVKLCHTICSCCLLIEAPVIQRIRREISFATSCCGHALLCCERVVRAGL